MRFSSLGSLLSLVFLLSIQAGLGQENDVKPFAASIRGVVQGQRKLWHRITIGFRGPITTEKATQNPFTFFRMDVTFTHRDSSRSYVVPGYYAADGNAANTGASGGDVWLVHFAPDLVGRWNWTASFVKGHNIATRKGSGTSADFFDGRSGTFNVEDTDKGGRDHRGKGRLSYVNKHHLQFANGEYFLKGGADSPENFLAYDDFDNTPNERDRRKSWQPHLRDSRAKDPTWRGGKGKAILGALNYLALEKGMNAFSFITMNIQGDDKNVFPYISDKPAERAYERMDVSKLAQWEVLFSHADKVGLFMHFKLQETENDQLLDAGSLGRQRKVYYRELIARFSHHLALNWNMGEENSNTRVQQLDFARYFRNTDPYNHPVVIHTYPNAEAKNRIFSGLVGDKGYTGISIQANQRDIYNDTLTWITESSKVNRPWVVSNDEQAGAGLGIVPDGEAEDPNHDSAREKVLYGNLMAGGAGVEYYFGSRFPNSDLTAQDFRSRDQFWDQTRYALNFFRNNKIPFWNMQRYDQPAFRGKWCLATRNRNMFVMYIRGTENMPRFDLGGPPANARYSIRWYNPRSGGKVQVGSARNVRRGGGREVGLPPGGSTEQDWILLLRLIETDSSPPATPAPSPAPRPTQSPIPATTPRPTQTPTPAPLPRIIVPSSAGGTVSGGLSVGGEVRLAFRGPTTRDGATTRYRMTIWVFGPDNSLFSVDGQFAGDGDLSKLDANNKQGNIWLATFSPTQTGRYWWSVEFRVLNGQGREESGGFFDDFFDTLVVS